MKKGIIFIFLLFISTSVYAQFKGHNSLGDFGIMAGSQPDPGLYASAFYLNYHTDKILDANGDQITFDPGNPGDISVSALAGLVWYVSDLKILGANYGAFVVFPFVNAALEVPVFGLEETSGFAFSDLYIQPLNLGWKTNMANYMAGLGIFIPTGNYEPAGDSNSGLGMWSFEIYGGATFFFDQAKSWHFSAIAWYEIHSEKKDTDVKVGDILSLEGGLGKSFLGGALTVGLAYYAQWKISEDDLGITIPEQFSSLFAIDKHKVYAIGPEATIPVPIDNKLVAMINVRYFWEFGARSTAEGNTLTITATFPIPSIPIN